METVNQVGSCDRNCNKTPAPRTRKISVDHSHLRSVYLDVNSNRLHCRRLSSWGEGSSLGAAILKLDGSNCDKTRATDNGVADWQNYFMSEIEKLAAAGKLDSASLNNSNAMNTCDTNRTNKHPKQRRQSTTHCMTDGLTRGSHGVRSFSVNNGARSRRKSCFTMSSDTSRAQHTNLNLPAWQGLRRVKNVNDAEHGGNVRRKSTVKQPTFTVPRLTNVQRKSYQIYKRRRRNRHKQEMARIDNEEDSINDNADVDINENPSRDEVHDQEVEEVAEDVEKELCDLVRDHLVTQDAEKPVPRRKNSIQTRSWEISRQRRKGRRRVEKETDG